MPVCITDSDEQKFVKPSYRGMRVRYVKGERYRPPQQDKRDTINGVVIQEGALYRARLSAGWYNADGICMNEPQVMIAAENQRGELMLCHIRNGKPFGGYPLRAFLWAREVNSV